MSSLTALLLSLELGARPANALRPLNAGAEESGVSKELSLHLAGHPIQVENRALALEFGSLVEQVHRIFDAEEKPGLLRKTIGEIKAGSYFSEDHVAYIPHTRGKIAVFGDRHGDYTTLEKELDLATIESGYDPEKNRTASEPVYLVFVGDYIDIGKRSLSTMTRILRLKAADPEHVVLISGNHDLARQTYESPDYLHDSENPWLFAQIDEILGDKAEGSIIYDEFNRLNQRMPNVVVTPNGLVIIHASPPNATVDNPEFGGRFDPRKGLLNFVKNRELQIQLAWNFIHRGKFEGQAAAELNTRFETPMPEWTDWKKGYWVSPADLEIFLSSIGGTVLIRGHDSEAPWDWTPLGGKVLSLMGLDWRSPDNGYPVEKRIRARFAIFDLSRRYDTIDPKEVLRFAWPETAGAEEAEVFTINPLKVLYRSEQAGAMAAALVQSVSLDPEGLPGFRPDDMEISKLEEGQEPPPYSIVVRTPQEVFPSEETWKQNRVAIVVLTSQTTLARLIQEALAQWNDRAIQEILEIEHEENGRLKIYT